MAPTSDVFEIVELENGDIALKQQGSSDDSYLVRIEFSPALDEHMKNGRLSVAQAMLKAGIQQFYQGLEQQGLIGEELDFDDETVLDKNPVIH